MGRRPIMNVNYAYFLECIKTLPNHDHIKALDYGCGNGEVVKLLRGAGVNCLGVDTFYEGSEYPIKEDYLFKTGIIKQALSN